MTSMTTQPSGGHRRRPRRQQIPSLPVTEGRLQPTAKLTSPPRRIGKGGRTRAERMTVSDQMIEDMDRECRPRWEIAAAARLSESQVYRRLKRLRERRKLARAVQAVMADTTLYG